MLNVYSRHYLPCLEHDLYHQDCRCPKWIYGRLPGFPRVRVSAHTRNWQEAEKCAHRLELDLQDPHFQSPSRAISIRRVVSAFIADQRGRHLHRASISKSKTLLERQLLPWCHKRQLQRLEQLTSSQMLDFRNQWLLAPSTARRKHEGLQSLFLFCLKHQWIRHSPMLQLKKPHIIAPAPTDYFKREEFNRVLAATFEYQYRGIDSHGRAGKIRALILLMRWSGLAILDAVSLKRACLNESDAIFLRRAKNGNPVCVPLPPKVARCLLRELPSENPLYFFWSGNGDPRSAVTGYMRSLRKLFRITDLRLSDGSPKRSHSHMFRDTFAIESLLAGVRIDQVSVLLGHTSVAMTEKHYLPWVPARQEQMSHAVTRAWFPEVSGL